MATITRNEVASMLGVSVATVRRMEGKMLHPRLVDGAWRFEADEVKSLSRMQSPVGRRALSEGEFAAEVFRRFDQGQSLRQIVRECSLAPKTVQALYREWNTPLGVQADGDEPEIAPRDEDELVRWEEAMRAEIAAAEELEARDRSTMAGARFHRQVP